MHTDAVGKEVLGTRLCLAVMGAAVAAAAVVVALFVGGSVENCTWRWDQESSAGLSRHSGEHQVVQQQKRAFRSQENTLCRRHVDRS